MNKINSMQKKVLDTKIQSKIGIRIYTEFRLLWRECDTARRFVFRDIL